MYCFVSGFFCLTFLRFIHIIACKSTSLIFCVCCIQYIDKFFDGSAFGLHLAFGCYQLSCNVQFCTCPLVCNKQLISFEYMPTGVIAWSCVCYHFILPLIVYEHSGCCTSSPTLDIFRGLILVIEMSV